MRGLDLEDSALYSALPFLAATLPPPPADGWPIESAGATADERDGRRGDGALQRVCCAGNAAQDARAASLVLVIGMGSLQGSIGCYWSVTADLGGPAAGAVSSVVNMGYQIGGAITVALTTLLAGRSGWSTAFVIAAGMCGLGALAWMLVSPARTLFDGVTASESGIVHASVGKKPGLMRRPDL